MKSRWTCRQDVKIRTRRRKKIPKTLFNKTAFYSKADHRECVHLVTHGHFRSRDKDGDHTIRSAVEKPHATRNPHGCYGLWLLRFYRMEVMAIRKFNVARIGIFDLFYSCNLDLYPMTFLHIRTCPYTPWIYRIPDVQILTSYVKAFETYRLTDRQTRNYIPRCFSGGQ